MILIGRGLDLKARVDVLSGQLPVQFSRCDGFKEVRRAEGCRKSEADKEKRARNRRRKANRKAGKTIGRADVNLQNRKAWTSNKADRPISLNVR